MEWMCSWCGAPQESDDPPCEHCGHGQFEKTYVRRSESAGAAATATTQWVCTECGRGHPKHSPPCSRCGHMTLEQRQVDVDPAELSAGSFRDHATPGALALFAVAMVLAAVLGLGVLGVADVPGVGEGFGGGGPDVPDAPGDPAAVDGTALAPIEDDYLATVDRERERRGAARLQRTDDLDQLATFYNRWWVRSEHGDDVIPVEELREHLGDACQSQAVLAPFQVHPSAYESVDEPGEAIATHTLARSDGLASVSATRTGLDVHAGPEGSLYVTQILC